MSKSPTRRSVTTMLAPAQVARLTNLSRAAVYRAIDRGELRASRLCGRLRVDPEDLEAWKARNVVSPSRRPPSPLRLPTNQGPAPYSFQQELDRRGQRRA